MHIRIEYDLAVVTATIQFQHQTIILDQVLLDTGSAGTLLAVDKLLPLGLMLEPSDPIHRIRGVGGSEFVFTKQLEQFSVGELALSPFEVEVGALAYGFPLDGIVGLDFLCQVKGHIDLERLILW